MRLWSVVVTHDAKPWRRQSAWTAGSAAATAQSFRVRVERVDLLVGPAAADRRHRADAVADERREAVAIGERRVARERGADERLVQLVAREADALELLLAERGLLDALVEEGDVLLARHDL